MTQNRRRFLYLGSATLASALAGCSSTPESNQGGETQTTASDGTTAGDGATATATTTATTSGGDGGGGTPGLDQLGGPDDLKSAPTVRAATLGSNQGGGKFVFSPAVVWVEEGATVTWEIKAGSHSVTAYHSNNDRNTRIPEGAESFDSGILSKGKSFEHTFSTPGVYNYFCRPHEALGMVGLVVVGGPKGGPGTTSPNVSKSAASQKLSKLLQVAGVAGKGGDGGGGTQQYGFEAATWDTYWYSLYNMSTNIAMNGNGVRFPHNEKQRKALQKRLPAMLKNADVDEPPIKNPYLNMAPFSEGDPAFTQKPVFDAGDGRPDASTLRWDKKKSSLTVTPSSVAWTHLKGLTWVKNFQNHFEVLPTSLAAKFRTQVLTTMAQLGLKATLVAGGPQGNGALTKGDSMKLVSGFNPVEGKLVDPTPRPNHHSAMLWHLSDFVSVANGGWYGYENPSPLIPAKKIQKLADGMAKSTMDQFSPGDVVSMGSTRDLGQMLGAVAWYGTHAGSDQLATRASDYAKSLADTVANQVDGDGRVGGGTENQAATQGAIGQGLVWASQLEGVDRTDLARRVLGYLAEDLWNAEAGVFGAQRDGSTHAYTARDAGDVTGGINAADAVLGMDVRSKFASFFDQTFNRGRLQRAERPPSRSEDAPHTLPLPPKAGGEYGQAAVYNGEVTYDASADEWQVTDRRFYTGDALYLANQDIWFSHWGGQFFQGRGVPGKSDTPK